MWKYENVMNVEIEKPGFHASGLIQLLSICHISTHLHIITFSL